MTEKQARKIVRKIFSFLSDRGGFDGWWADVDHDIQIEIKDAITQIILYSEQS